MASRAFFICEKASKYKRLRLYDVCRRFFVCKSWDKNTQKPGLRLVAERKQKAENRGRKRGDDA